MVGRSFSLLGITGIALLMTRPALAQDAASAVYDQQNRAQTMQRDVSFAEPQTYYAAVTGSRVTLEVVEAVNTFADVRLRHRSYNGGLV